MALRSTHIAVTGVIVSSYLLVTNQSLLVDGTCLLGTWLGVQLPDLDTGNTWISRQLGVIGSLLGHIFKHRTWTHTVWAILLMFFLSRILPAWQALRAPDGRNYLRIFYQMVAWGYLLHIVEDAFSRQGVCWFYPLQRFRRSKAGFRYRKRPWHWFYYRTGGKAETVVRWLARLLWIYLLVRILLLRL